jgi:hypothetical protein
MKQKNLGALLLAGILLTLAVSACFSAPQVGKIDPTGAVMLKDIMATHDTLGSLVKIKLNGVVVNADEVNLLVLVNSRAQQADLVVEVPAINGRPVRLIDSTGATGEKLPLLSGQQVITATFPKPGSPKDWAVKITVSNVNGVEGNFGWLLPIEPYYK